MNKIIIIACILLVLIFFQKCFRSKIEKYENVINIPVELNPDTSLGHLVGKNVHVMLDDKCKVIHEDNESCQY